MTKIKTYCPLFKGFYNTIFEADESEFLHSENLTFEDIETDYQAYYKDVSKAFCSAIEYRLGDYIKTVELESLYRPKEYNFSTDSINCIIQPKIKAIKQYINENKADFTQYLKDRLTPCSGFIPYYSNRFEDWNEYTNNFTTYKKSEFYLGFILDFIGQNEGIEQTDLYYDCEINIDNYITVITKDFEDLYDFEQTEILINNFELIEPIKEIGYFSILWQNAAEKSNKIGEDIKEVFCSDYSNLIAKSIGITKVNYSNEPIFN